jgi:hypothetical protein
MAAVCLFVAAVAAAFAVTTARRPRAVSSAAGTSRVASQAPLELIALEHDRDGDQFIVRGIVRNPAAAAIDGLAAAVSAFNRDGGLVATQQAAVAAAHLAAGAETPFVVTIPGAGGDIERYHLSFRTAAGLVPHLDRRASRVLAAVQLVS